MIKTDLSPAESDKRNRMMRSWLTFAGFACLCAGLCGAFGPWVALMAGGLIVFVCGLVGLLR